MNRSKRVMLFNLCTITSLIILFSSVEIPGNNLLVTFAAADTISGGDVSGTWYAANSPYYITGDITIPAGNTLVIEPGVSAYFMSHVDCTINGFLEAVGTPSDSIYFARDASAGYWQGLRFTNAPDYSHLDYCSISGVDGIPGSDIRCMNNSDPIISHCRLSVDSLKWYPHIDVLDSSNPSISDCVITGGRMGIWLLGTANSTISGCTISNFDGGNGVWKTQCNLTMIDCTISDVFTLNYNGAGIRSEDGNLTLINCSINNNTSSGAGGGVYCNHGSHTISNCTFSDNSSWNNMVPLIGGGGICFDDADGSVSYCTFCGGFTGEGGPGISINGTGNLTVDHCTIDGNDSWERANAIWLIGSPTADVTNTIISNNTGGYGSIVNQGTISVEYTDFYNNDGSLIVGNVPAGFGELTGVNYNGDPCDVYYNIFMDPMFLDQPSNDYHLTSGSPCIDAGDPAFPLDPDGTITDMGMYYFNQTGIHGEPPDELLPSECLLLCSPNPCCQLLTVFFDIPGQSVEELAVYSIDGRQVVDMIDLCGSGAGEAVLDVSCLNEGIYFCRLKAGSSSGTVRFVVIR